MSGVTNTAIYEYLTTTMKERQDKLEAFLNTVRGELGVISQHLATLNGTVAQVAKETAENSLGVKENSQSLASIRERVTVQEQVGALRNSHQDEKLQDAKVDRHEQWARIGKLAGRVFDISIKVAGTGAILALLVKETLS